MHDPPKSDKPQQTSTWFASDASAAPSAKLSMRSAEIIARVATAVAREVRLSDMVSAVLDLTKATLDARAVHVYLAVEEQRELQLLGQRNLPADLIQQVERVSYGAPFLAARAAHTRQIQAVSEVAGLDPELTVAREVLARTNSSSIVSAPLVAFDRLVGVLTFTLPDPHEFSPEELAALSTVAEIFAVGLANAQAFERERQLREQVEAVSDAALAISEEFDLPAVLQTIVDQARRVAGAAFAALGVGTDPNQPFDPWVYSGLSPEQAATIGRIPRPIGLLGAVPREGRTIRLRDLPQSPKFRGAPQGHLAMASFLGVPIRYQGRSVGNLYLVNKVGGNSFTEADQRAVELLAQHAALAVEHAQVHWQMAQEIADRKRTEEDRERLLEREQAATERFAAVLRAATDYAIMAADLNGITTIFNEGAERMLGYLADEVVGKVTPPLWHDSTEIAARAAELGVTADNEAFVAVARQQGTETREWTFVRKDRSRFTGLLTIARMHDAQGKLSGFIGIARDITAQKQAEKELRYQLDLTSSITRHVAEGLLLVDDHGRFTYVNPAAAAMLGWQSEELVGRDVHTTIHPPAILAASCPYCTCVHLATIRSTQVRLNCDDVFLRKDGTQFPVSCSSTPVISDGKVHARVFAFRDVTESRRAEAERARLLAQVEADRNWLRMVIDSSPAGIILFEGARGERLVANGRAEELFGHRLDPDLGASQYAGEVCRPDGGPLNQDDLISSRALRGEVISGDEELLRRQDGREVPVLVSASPIRDGAGAIIGAIVVFEDITPLKELEQLREEWISIIAHDLRQPITAINGFAALLERQTRGAPALQSKVEHILSGVGQLNRMITDLLDASRLEARRLQLERQTVQLPDLVKTLVDRMAATTTGHPVRVEIIGDIPPLEADPGRLEQVLGNLLSNAAKYGTPASEILVKVERCDQEVCVSVTNQGAGIAPEELPRLFSRFRRARRLEQRQVGGIGLGLYIAKGLVESHGGRIWAESVPGQRTTVSFTLPLPPADVATMDKAA